MSLSILKPDQILHNPLVLVRGFGDARNKKPCRGQEKCSTTPLASPNPQRQPQ